MGRNLKSDNFSRSKKSAKSPWTKLINVIKKEYPNALDFEAYKVSGIVAGIKFRKEVGEDFVTLKGRSI